MLDYGRKMLGQVTKVMVSAKIKAESSVQDQCLTMVGKCLAKGQRFDFSHSVSAMVLKDGEEGDGDH